MNDFRRTIRVLVLPLLAALWGCAASPPIERVSEVDLERFMGDWYVIAHIPTFIEADAFNAVERYERNPDGSIATTFSFNSKALDGERKVYQATGFVQPGTGDALWNMQFLWPFKSEYVIGLLDPEYRHVVIVRSARDYAWVMSRERAIPDGELARLLAWLTAQGYSLEQLRRVPHSQITSH